MAVKKSAAPAKGAAKKAPSVAGKSTAIATKQSKTEIIATIAEETGLNRKEVNAVFDSLATLVERHMKKRGSGEFTIPAVGAKIRRVRKPATKARKGVNPFTGEAMVFAAKPARNQVKISALKALKETVEK